MTKSTLTVASDAVSHVLVLIGSDDGGFVPLWILTTAADAPCAATFTSVVRMSAMAHPSSRRLGGSLSARRARTRAGLRVPCHCSTKLQNLSVLGFLSCRVCAAKAVQFVLEFSHFTCAADKVYRWRSRTVTREGGPPVDPMPGRAPGGSRACPETRGWLERVDV